MRRAKKIAPDRARTPEAKEELRSRILREAIHLFAEVGYQQFTMRKLADRIGYTATTIYSYYKNKDELLFEVIANGWEQFAGYLARGEGDPVTRLRAIGNAYLDFAFENRELYQLMFMHRPQFLFDLREEKVASRVALLDGIANLTGAMPALKGSDPESLRTWANIFWSVVHGLASLAIAVPIYDEAWARRNLELLFERLAPQLNIHG